jgi:hypothetical protein
VTGYVVRVRPAGSLEPATEHVVTGTSTVIAGLANARSYEVSVVARNAVGESPASDVASAQPMLAPVTGLTASGVLTDAGEPAVTATWTLPADATGAVACLVPGTSPAPSSCSGETVSTELPSTRVTLPIGQPVTLTIFATDADGRGQGTSVTLTRSTLTAGRTALTTVAGQAVELDAELTGGPAGSRNATLWSRTGNGPWTLVASVDSTGTFTAPVQKPKANTSYQWRFAGAGGIVGSVSAVTTVSVAPAITTTLAPASIKVGRASVAWGTLNPSTKGAQVTLEVKAGKRWSKVGTAVVKKQKMPNRKTLVGYRFTVTGKKPGKYTYRVVSAATPANAAGTGPSVVLKVG